MKLILFISAFKLLFVFTCNGQISNDALNDIRAKYQQITSDQAKGNLKEIMFDIDCEYPTSGSLKLYFKNDDLKLIEHNITWSDHQGETRQYYIWDNKLFFAYYKSGGWSFDFDNPDPDKPITNTIDYYNEERYYFVNGIAKRCLSKEFEIKSKDKNPTRSADIPNKEIDCWNGENVKNQFTTLFFLKDSTEIDCFWE